MTTLPDSSMSSPKPKRLCVMLPTPMFLVTWWAVLLLHTFTAIFALSASMIHFTLSLPAFDQATSALHIPVLLKRITGLGYLMITILHVKSIVRMIYSSILARELTLMDTESRAASMGPRQPSLSLELARSRTSSVRVVYTRAVKLWSIVFGPYGALGLHGPLFSPSLLLREVIEVAMQSYQLWSLSYYVSRTWINNFAVATVVLNCFSISIVNRLFRSRQGLKRLMHLVVDMYLDFTCAVIVPMLVLTPYAVAFNWSTSTYPIELLANDVWMANAIAEGRQALVTSYLDFFASLLPQYSIFSCLRLLKRLIERKRARQLHSHRGAISPLKQTPARQKTSVDLMKEETTRASTATESGYEIQTRGMRFVSLCVGCWAVVVLGFHLQSAAYSRRQTVPGCQLYVRPWLAANVSCSVMHINCFHRNISGSADQVASVLDQLERVVLTKVVFIRCPALTIPTNIREFPNLQGFEIGASTLKAWPAEASVKASTHSSLGAIVFSQSNVSAIPPGLLHRELPRTLTTILFFNCSLATLPEDLGDVWATSGLSHFGLENTRVKTIPRSLGRMSMRFLWMTSNSIEDFPDTMFANSRFLSIRLSGNPLIRLPSTVGDVSALKELLVEHTNVSSLPLWATTWLDIASRQENQRRRSFFSSPVCDRENSEMPELWGICNDDSHSMYGSVPPSIVKEKYNY